MTTEKMLELIRRYRGALRCWGYKAEKLFLGETLSRYDHRDLTLGHCITILDNAERLIELNCSRKALDLIKFVQNSLWKEGFYDISEFKKHLHFS
ncbi:MAG: hypothetical protein ACYCY6_02725 [Minisyncoccota bacterium]